MIKNRDVFKLRSSSRLFTIPTIESITIIIIIIIVVIIILPKCRSR